MHSSIVKRIQIYVYLPAKCAIKISTPSNKLLGDLFQQIPSKNVFYVFKGMILSNDQSLNSVGIKDGDIIVLFFRKNMNRNILLSLNQNTNQNVFNKTYNFDDIRNILLDYEEINNDDWIRKWIEVTKDTKFFNESLKTIINQSNAKESAKLKDLRFLKLELKQKCYRNLCNGFNELSNNEQTSENGKKSSLIIDYSSNNEPSTEPLPILDPLKKPS